MIQNLVHHALSRRLFTVVLGVVICSLGLWSWHALNKEAYPDVGDTQVTVVSQFRGRAAEEVELQVTRPLERALNSVPQVIVRRSKTIFGLSVIQLTFEDGVNDYFARQRVLEQLATAHLPEGVEPELAPLTGPVGEILRYVVEGTEGYTPMELRTLQDWVIVPRLLQVSGVADVITFGGLVKQYHVITSPEKLAAYHLSLQNVIDSVVANNKNTGGNIIQQGGQGFAIRGIGAIRTPTDIQKIVVSAKDGVPVFVENLATVEASPMPPSGILGYSIKDANNQVLDDASGVQGLIAMRRGENASIVVAGLKEKIEAINAKDLPKGVKLRVTYDRADLVNYTIETVSHTLFEGISLVLIVLIFFIGSVRAALVVALTIPLSLLFAFSLMKLTGIPANLLSLGAIDFGIIVDGAVVMAENIMRHYKDASTEEKAKGIVLCTLHAAQEVSQEIFFSIVIIVAAYFPIFTFQRVEGKLFSPMAYTLAFAILGSMILALTVVPVLMTFVFRRYFTQANPKPIEWHNPLYAWLERQYSRVLVFLTENAKTTVLASFALVFAICALGVMKIGTEFLPNLDEGSINVRAFFPAGIHLKEADHYTAEIRRIVSSYKPVNLVVTQQGRNDDGTDPYCSNRLEILVGLKDYSLWQHEISKDDLLAQIKKDLQTHIPGVVFAFSQPILDNVTEAVTGSVADLAIQINGEDLALMRKKANEVLDVIKTISGASEYGIEQEGVQPQVVVDINRSEAARFGINISDIQTMIEAAIGGRPISVLYEGSKRFDIVVRYAPEFKDSIDAIKRMRVISPSGAQVPMNQLASIRLVDGQTLIQRQDGLHQISVRTNIRDRDQGGFVEEAKRLVENKVSLPEGYTMTWGGRFENLSRAGARLKIVIPLTILIIFLILYSLYKNTRQVMIALSCIPFSLIGGLLALYIRGYNFNVSAGVGFISLFGIATMSGVLFVSRVKHLRIASPNQNLVDVVQQAAKLQLRPWLMTVIPALLGLIPAALAQGIGSDVQRPLATVIVGGLASGLILTLLTLPSLYCWVERGRHEGDLNVLP
jgi:cobalt-zinc-cadmium resistance protein CzcA